MNPKLSCLEIDVSCEASGNFQWQISQSATPATEFTPCHNLTQPWQCDSQKTRNMTRLVLRLPRKRTMEVSKVLHPPRKMQCIFWKRGKSIAPAAKNDFRHVTKHVWMPRSATPATRNKALRRWKHPKATPFAELTIGKAIRPSHERLRTVANVNATSSKHTLNPQTSRVKGEPLLRIREKGFKKTSIAGWAREREHGFNCHWTSGKSCWSCSDLIVARKRHE